ncbi:MAG: hypothetical protein Q8N18_12260 [Opitutaceae bacterium]|nr:hypothetical protein [Opitutaceae bacterium]
MAIYDLFSKRRQREKGEAPDVFQYDVIPQPLRVQITHIIDDAFSIDAHGRDFPFTQHCFEILRKALCREYGKFHLIERERSAYLEVVNFFLTTTSTDQVLDVVELTFRFVAGPLVDNRGELYHGGAFDAADAIDELNARFREHGCGYQFEGGQIIRVDSQLVHAEVVKPALGLLASKQYEGPNEEFRSAFAHYRDGSFDECLVDCGKTLESTLKVICSEKNWAFDANAPAKRLLEIVFANGLIPAFSESHFAALRSTLENGVPTVRNKLGGHGQGGDIRVVPRHLAAYALHLTAANVVLLVEAAK